MFYWFVQIMAGITAKILFRVRVEGLENIPNSGPFILASNHRSNLDPVIVSTATGRKLYFMGKKELFDNKFSTAFFEMLNVIRLNREGIDKSALKKAITALRDGRGLLLFPEGTRSMDGRLGQAKAGVALFAVGTDIPVIPAFIRGSERALAPHSRFIKPVNVMITFGERLRPPALAERADRKSVYEDFTNRIMQGIAELEKTPA